MHLVQREAEAVAVHLGEDRRRGDRGHLRVALDDGLRLYLQHRQPVAVDQHLVRPQSKALDSAAHRQQRGLQDVERVDLLDAGLGDAAAQRLRADLVEQPLAHPLAQDLGVAQAADRLRVVEDHRRSHHRPGQRPAARLVDAGQQARDIPRQAELPVARQARRLSPR